MEQKLTRVRDRQKQNIKSGLMGCVIFSMVLIVAVCALLLLEYLSSGNIPDGVGVLSSYRHEATIQDGVIYNKYYDKDNHLVKWFHTDFNGTLVDVDHDGWVYHSAVSEYEDGKEISWTTYSYEGSIYQAYDKNGNCLIYESLDTEGAPRIDPDWGYYKMESAYFPDTNIEEKSTYYTIDRIEEYTYNGKSQLIEEEYYDLNKNYQGHPERGYYKAVHHYDEDDEGDGTFSIEYYENYEVNKSYYADGSVRSISEYSKNKNGDIIKKIRYNANGDIIGGTQYNADGSAKTVEYYDDANELEQTGHEPTSSNQAIDYEPEEDVHANTRAQHKVVYITGATVNLRSGPGTEHSIVVSVKNGDSLDYAGLMESDSRGIGWYSVVHPEKGMAWVSSKFSELWTVFDD